MCKKIFMGAVLAAVGLFVLNVAGLSSYSGTVFSKVRTSLKKQVPLEFEIERLHNQVNQLMPDMKLQFSSLAEEMVAVDNLREDIADTRSNLQRQKDNMNTMLKDLESGAQTISYGGKAYPASRVRTLVSRDLASYKRCAAELKSKEQLLEAKEKSLDASREKLASMRSQKDELEVQLAQIEAELKTVRLAQTRTKCEIDDSALAQCKATLAEIKTRLRVEKTATELHGEFANDTIAVEKKTPSVADLAKEIKATFQEEAVATDRK
jgi:peptidoglycan hydrolase CwlO-like protein